MNATRGFVFGILAMWVVLAAASPAQKRSITEKDLFRFTWIADPQISPDGAQVAFTRVTVDEKKTGYETAIWVVSKDGNDERQLTSGRHDAQPRWSPDGKWLAFVRSIEKETKPQPPQIYLLPRDGGEAWPLTKIAKGAGGPEWSPDSKAIAFFSVTNAEDLARALCEEKAAAESSSDSKQQTVSENEKDKQAKEKAVQKCGKPEHETDIQVVTRAEYRGDNEGYFDFSRPPHIWTVAIPTITGEASQAKQITTGNFSEDELEWSADGMKIYFTSTRNLEPYYGLPQNALYSVVSSGGEPSEVAKIQGYLGAISVSPDGNQMAFLGTGNTPVQSYTQANLWILDLKAAESPRNLTEKRDWDMGGGIIGDQEPPRGSGPIRPLWSRDGKSVTIVVAKQGRANLERFDVESGTSKPITTGDQSVTQYTSNGDHFVAEISTPVILNDLYLIDSDPKQPKRLTHVNEKLFAGLNLTAPEEIAYDTFDGKKIQAFVQKPPDFDSTKKYPLILNIHGGPHTAYGYLFFHEMQWMAAKGYVVLYPNPRGSTSFGEEFANIIQYKYPGDDYKDLMAGADEMIKLGYVNPKQLGVTGGSGGGLLTDWVIGHTDRFAAAVAQRDIANWSDWWYSDDFSLFRPAWFRKPPFEDAADYQQRSPITYINNVKTPLMLISGDADFRTPPGAGGEQMFRALKFRKVPTTMVRFPNEGHELSRSGQPWHRVERLHHIVGWFDVYLQGQKSNEYELVPPLAPDWEKSAE